MAADREERSHDFEEFLAQTLLPDLHRAEAAREVFASELRAYEELKDLVLKLQKARCRPLSPQLASRNPATQQPALQLRPSPT